MRRGKPRTDDAVAGGLEAIRSLVQHHDVATMHWVHPSSSQYNGQAASRSLPSLFRREAGIHLLHGPQACIVSPLLLFLILLCVSLEQGCDCSCTCESGPCFRCRIADVYGWRVHPWNTSPKPTYSHAASIVHEYHIEWRCAILVERIHECFPNPSGLVSKRAVPYGRQEDGSAAGA